MVLKITTLYMPPSKPFVFLMLVSFVAWPLCVFPLLSLYTTPHFPNSATMSSCAFPLEYLLSFVFCLCLSSPLYVGQSAYSVVSVHTCRNVNLWLVSFSIYCRTVQ